MNDRSRNTEKMVHERRVCLATFLLASVVASCTTVSTPTNSIEVALTLPPGMWTNVARTIGRVEIWLDEGGTASLFSTPTELAGAKTPEGLDYQYQIADVDGDGRLEFWLVFPSSPFGSGRTKSVTLLGNPSFGTFVINAALYRSGSNALLGTARATLDTNGYAIQFSGTRAVSLQFGCEPLLNCPVPADGGTIDLDAGPEEGSIVVNWVLPQSPEITLDPAVRAALGPFSLTFDEIDGGSLFAADSQRITARTYDAIAFDRLVADVDGDGYREFQVNLLQNPFGSLTSWPMSFSGTSSISPFAVRGRLYSNDGGTIVAEAVATTDIASQAIRFGGGDKSVNLAFRCLSEAVCKTLDAGNVFVDAGADGGADAGVDAGEDAGEDAGIIVDAGVDASADAGTETDAGVDAGADAGADAGVDAGVDAGIDAGVDTGDGGYCSGFGAAVGPYTVCTWGQPTLVYRLASGSVDTGAVSIAMAANNDAVAVWSFNNGSGSAVWANRYAAGLNRWLDAGPIDNGALMTAGSTYNAVAIARMGNAIATWRWFDGSNYRTWINRTACPETGWVGAGDLDAGATEPAGVVANEEGDVTVAWINKANNYYRAKRFVDGGWTPNRRIDEENGTGSFGLKLATNTRGDVVAVWMKQVADRYALWANRLQSSTGGWGDAGRVDPARATQTYISQYSAQAIDSNGNATIVYRTTDGGTNDGELFAARLAADAGLWINAGSIESTSLGIEYPYLGADESGNLLALFGVSSSTMYQNAFTAGSVTWGDAGPWGADGGGSTSSLDGFAVFPSGDALAVRLANAFRYNRDAGVWAEKVTIPTDAGMAWGSGPSFAANDRGGAVIFWYQEEGSAKNLWATFCK